MSKLPISALLLVGAFIASIPANASDNTYRIFQGAPKIKTENGYWKLRGRFLWDYAALQEDFAQNISVNIDDNEIRAARIGIEGKYKKIKYKAEIDFAGNYTEIKDLHIVFKGPVDIMLGQMKAGLTMEEENSSRFTTFIERAMITDAVGFDRRIGVQFIKSGENYGLSGGVFGNSVNGIIDDRPGNRIIAGRAHFAPVLQKDKLLHLGLSLRHTDRQSGAPKRSARWGPHLAREKIKPKIGRNALLSAIEFAGKTGPFHAQAEFINEEGDLGKVRGGFIQAGYFLTGESRKYKPASGKFDRTRALRPLSEGGFGAVEIAARFDSLNAEGASDEKVENWSLGASWYPKSHLRLSVNYTNASGQTFNAKGIYTRIQFDW